MFSRAILFSAAFLLSALLQFHTQGFAGIITDQEQPDVNTAAGYLGVGGDEDQKLAQSFTVGMTGELAGLRLPLTGCGRGALRLTIREINAAGFPEGAVLRARNFPADEVGLIGIGEFQDFFFSTPLAVSAGDILAFTVETVGEDSYCSMGQGPDGDSYPRGNAFFDSRPNPPGWVSQKEFPSAWQDLPFYTLMDDPSLSSPGMCVAADGTALPISRDVPACRCFEDAGAMEFRCGIVHPDFFIFRRFPFPMEPEQPFEQIWEFYPLTELDGPVWLEVSGGGLEREAKFVFAPNGGRGAMEVKTLKGMAPSKGQIEKGLAVIRYDMKDAPSKFFRAFGVDVSVKAGAGQVDQYQLQKELEQAIPEQLKDALPQELKDKLPEFLPLGDGKD
jgi:hypothetical protein